MLVKDINEQKKKKAYLGPNDTHLGLFCMPHPPFLFASLVAVADIADHGGGDADDIVNTIVVVVVVVVAIVVLLWLWLRLR